MSHACVLVAVDVVDPSDRLEVEAAVAFQMQPYDENGEWFADGSRWDWYQIGGRFTGIIKDDIVQLKNVKRENIKPFYAFLRERHWHEGLRLGWLGCNADTECEIKHADDPDVLTRRCLTIGNENSRIVTWQEPWELWKENFVKRFIDPLKPETVLVVVDYHV